MAREYSPLPVAKLDAGAGYAQPTQPIPDHVTLDSPAVEAMTDLMRTTAVIVLPGDSVDEARRRMIQRGVRLLLVVDQDRLVLGVITANDVLGEKPVQIAVDRGVSRGDVAVRDVMTPQERLEVVALADVRASKVGHVVATLRRASRQHALVVDCDDRGRQRVRGIYSVTQIARQLGIAIQASEVAGTFAEIESQLAH